MLYLNLTKIATAKKTNNTPITMIIIDKIFSAVMNSSSSEEVVQVTRGLLEVEVVASLSLLVVDTSF